MLERNRSDDTFGWGVVLSDDALGKMERNDPESAAAIRSHFAYWDDIAVVHDGVRTVSGGHGFAGIGRMTMLLLLQERARELGVDLRFQTEFASAEEYRHEYDLVVACDGINSRRARTSTPTCSGPTSTCALCKFIWLGTHQQFDDAFTFIFEQTEHGWMWAHAYQFDADTATVIVECTAADVGRVGLRGDEQGGDDRHLRARLRPPPRRPRADVERQPPPRLGGVDELPPGASASGGTTRTSC